jgi:hypothetical protein
VQPVTVAQRAQPSDDLEQHPLHQIVDIRLISHPSSHEGAQVGVQFLPGQFRRCGR